MPFKTLVKAGSINNLTDARFFSSFQVDWIGFNFDPLSPYAVTLEQAKEIMNWLAGPAIVAEFNNRSLEEITFISNALGVKGVQVPYEQNISGLEGDFKIIKELRISPESVPMAIYTDVDFLLLEIYGLEKLTEKMPADLDAFIRDTCENIPTILSLPFDAENIESILNIYKPSGINLYGSDELQTGVKEFNELVNILEKIEI